MTASSQGQSAPSDPQPRALPDDSKAAPQQTSARQHCYAILLALACSVMFLRDGLLPGRALVPHPPELLDVHMAEAKAAGTFDPEDAFRGNVGMTDKYLQSLCWDRVMQDRLRAGELPRWTRDIGGGAPFVQQMAQPYQPINLLLLAVPSEQWYGLWFLLHQVLFGWFAYAFLRRIGCSHAGALLGLVAAVLGMWTQCKLHHNVILTAALSLWPMLSAVHELVVRGATGPARRRAIGWLALWAGLSWSTGFVVIALQATYLTLLFAAGNILAAPRKRLRRLLPVGIGFAIGGLLSLANMLPILLASAESARGDFSPEKLLDLSLEWSHLLGAAWPDLLSWPSDFFYANATSSTGYDTRMPLSQLVLLESPTRASDNSAFQNWVETSFAVGTVPLAAAISALFARGHRMLSGLCLLVAVTAFGIATASEPFFTLARIAPGVTAADLRRLLFSVSMPLVVLAGLGGTAWVRGSARWPARCVWLALAAASLSACGWLWQNSSEPDFALACAELFVMDQDHPDVVRAQGNAQAIAAALQQAAAPHEIANNQLMLLRTAMWSLLVSLAALAASWFARGWTMAVLIAITLAELLVLGAGPVQTVPAERVTAVPKVLAPVAAQQQEGKPRPRLQRLVRNANAHAGLPGNLPGFLGFADANAYNPLPPARFEEFFNCIEAGVGYGGAGVGSFHDAASLEHALCDLYGIRYILTREDVPRSESLRDRTPAGTGDYRLLERRGAMPRATFVRTVDVIADRDQRLEALSDAQRDVRTRIVLEDQQAPRPAATTPPMANTSGVRVVHHADERVELQVSCSHDGYVRLADPFDPGWRATVDGEPVEVLVADHYLRAVYVEPGEHKIVFTYDGARVVWPARLALLGWLAVVFCLATGSWSLRSRR